MFKVTFTFFVKTVCVILLIVFGHIFILPDFGFTETLDGSGPFDSLLISVLELLSGSILSAVLIFSIVGFGISIALFTHNRDSLERFAKIVLGLLISAKGAGFVATALGLSFLI